MDTWFPALSDILKLEKGEVGLKLTEFLIPWIWIVKLLSAGKLFT